MGRRRQRTAAGTAPNNPRNNPAASPSEIGFFDSAGSWASDVTVSGSYAYVTYMDNGLRIFDISNPASPSSVGNEATDSWSYGITVAGNYVYLADGNDGLQIIDITDPTAPITVGNYNSPVQVNDVVVIGNYLYLSDISTFKIFHTLDVLYHIFLKGRKVYLKFIFYMYIKIYCIGKNLNSNSKSNLAIIGNISGIINIVVNLFRRFSRIRVDIIAGTEQPKPITIGIKLLPCRPILCITRSITNAALAM